MNAKQTFATVVEARGNEPEITISTVALDRDSDVIVPEGCDLSGYRRNPVVGYQHFRHDSLPIGSTTSIDIVPGRGIKARWRWLENDPLANRVRNAFDQGVLRAASVGFIASEWSDVRETGGRRFTKWCLLEWSLVAVPANPEAVRVLRGLDLWNDELLDIDVVDDGLEVDAELERAGREALARRMNGARLAGLTFDFDERQVRGMVRELVAETLNPRAIAEVVRTELRRARGRVD
jgi:HK97 family phage prohead protease